MKGWKGNLYIKAANLMPLKTAYALRYYHWYGRWPNLNNPELFTEKIMWLTEYNKLYLPGMIQQIYDKYEVREYVREKGCEDILIPLLGNYSSADEIDFESLPEEYILKSTQSSGQNIIVTAKTKKDEKSIKKEINQWLKQNKKSDRFQGYYYTDREQIICEELLRDENGEIPKDIKVFCCDGQAKWIQCNLDSITDDMEKKHDYKREFFAPNWEYLPVDGQSACEEHTKKPENLEEIIRIAEKLSEGFAFMRVDVYNVGGKVYFGELTPIPGVRDVFPIEWDMTFGQMIRLPAVRGIGTHERQKQIWKKR